MSKRALGKGIGALINDIDINDEADQKSEAGINSVSINRIKKNPEQPRKEFNEEKLQELANSIEQQGVIQPILVEKKGEDYFIIAGERRYRASIKAGLKEIPVIIKNLTEEEKLEIALIENIQRENLSAIEEAEAYKHLIEKTGINQEELAVKLGKSRVAITNTLRLLKLNSKFKAALLSNEITAGHARALLSIVNPADQMILFSRILHNALSVREAEKQAVQLNNGNRAEKTIQKKEQLTNRNFELDNLEQKFIDVLGTKVSLKGNLKKGKIEISYFSLDDLNRIYEILT